MKKKDIPIYGIKAFEQPKETHDFYTNTLAEHLKHHHFIKVAHKHDFYLTVLFTQGTGTHEVDFKNYKVKPGAVFFLSPGQMHNWILSDDIDGYIFFHTRDFYDLKYQYRHIQDFPFFSSIYNSPVLMVDPGLLKKVEAIFGELLTEYRSAAQLRSAKLCSLADLLYIDFTRVYVPAGQFTEAGTGYMQKFRELEVLVDRHFKEIKSPSAYADLTNMTTKHLNRICKTCVNRTLSDIIHDRIILEAKRLLAQPGDPVVDVANKLGMFDQSYFARFFKKNTGKTPLEFANMYRK